MVHEIRYLNGSGSASLEFQYSCPNVTQSQDFVLEVMKEERRRSREEEEEGESDRRNETRVMLFVDL